MLNLIESRITPKEGTESGTYIIDSEDGGKSQYNVAEPEQGLSQLASACKGEEFHYETMEAGDSEMDKPKMLFVDDSSKNANRVDRYYKRL